MIVAGVDHRGLTHRFDPSRGVIKRRWNLSGGLVRFDVQRERGPVQQVPFLAPDTATVRLKDESRRNKVRTVLVAFTATPEDAGERAPDCALRIAEGGTALFAFVFEPGDGQREVVGIGTHSVIAPGCAI